MVVRYLPSIRLLAGSFSKVGNKGHFFDGFSFLFTSLSQCADFQVQYLSSFLCFWLGPCILINFYKWMMGNSHNPDGWQRHSAVSHCNIKMFISLWYWKVLWHFKINELARSPPLTPLGFLWPFFHSLVRGFCMCTFLFFFLHLPFGNF